MRTDIDLKEKRSFRDTPRNIAILTTVLVVVVSALSGWLSYDVARHMPPPSQTIIINFPPGTTIQVPPDAPK